MEKSLNILTNWHHSPKELIPLLKKKPDDVFLLAKYIIVEYDHEKKELRLVKRSICPVEAKLDGNKINWRINDCDALCDPLNGTTDIAGDPRIGNDCLYYDVESEPKENGTGLSFTTISVIAAVAAIDMRLPHPTYDVSMRNDNSASRLLIADSKEEAAKLDELLSEFISKD